MDRETIILGTRGSKLALWQTEHVKAKLEEVQSKPVEIRVIKTKGDEILNKPLPEIGGKGVFTEELEEALLSGEIDAAVHSAKDLPTELPKGLTIGAFLERERPADAVVTKPGSKYFMIQDLPEGTVIGTSSTRRQALVRHKAPGLVLKDIRGNVDTRIQKMLDGHVDALLLAYAGVKRLGFLERDDISVHPLLERDFYHAVGQGCIAIECRSPKKDQAVFKKLNHEETSICVKVERQLLGALGGGCSLPLGVFSEIVDRELILKAILLDSEGKEFVTCSESTRDLADDKFAEGIVYEIKARGSGELLQRILGDNA